MKALTKETRDHILFNLRDTREKSKISFVYKPHLYLALQKVMDVNNDYTIEDIEYDKLHELDQLFFNEQLKDSINPFRSQLAIVRSTMFEWCTRLPTWLESPEMKMVADRTYRDMVVRGFDNHYYTVDDVPDYIDVLSVVKPDVTIAVPVKAIVGTCQTNVTLAPALSPEQVRAVFKTVLALKDHVHGIDFNGIHVTIPKSIVDFLTDGTIPEGVSDRVVLASVATSPTPYKLAIEWLLRNVESKFEDLSMFKSIISSKALDLDSEYNAVRRSNDKPILTNKQALAVINKALAKVDYKDKLKAKDIYYRDYEVLSFIRFFDEPLKALLHFFESTGYLEKAVAA